MGKLMWLGMGEGSTTINCASELIDMTRLATLKKQLQIYTAMLYLELSTPQAFRGIETVDSG
jgi:hypothetical protein